MKQNAALHLSIALILLSAGARAEEVSTSHIARGFSFTPQLKITGEYNDNVYTEINRLATDSICDYLWTPSADATAQLLAEGADRRKISEVGNVMIDAYCLLEDKIARDRTREEFGLAGEEYIVATFHRPANVDDIDQLEAVCAALQIIAARTKVVFPVHPRTQQKLNETALIERLKNVRMCEPLPYIAFMNLVSNARLAITDSGGVQEETTYLGIPCLTVRTTTERPITIHQGTNRLAKLEALPELTARILASPLPERPRIAGWDGKAAQRTLACIDRILNKTSSGRAFEQARQRRRA